MLYKHALWMTGSQETAMDMVQETFFQAWQGVDSLQDRQKALPWLLTILRRAIYREQRTRYRHQETLLALQARATEVADDDAYGLLEIYQAMEQISLAQREVFLLHHLHGLSYEEISEQLQVPIGTVMSRLSRARAALKKRHCLDADNVVNLAERKKEQAT